MSRIRCPGFRENLPAWRRGGQKPGVCRVTAQKPTQKPRAGVSGRSGPRKALGRNPGSWPGDRRSPPLCTRLPPALATLGWGTEAASPGPRAAPPAPPAHRSGNRPLAGGSCPHRHRAAGAARCGISRGTGRGRAPTCSASPGPAATSSQADTHPPHPDPDPDTHLGST